MPPRNARQLAHVSSRRHLNFRCLTSVIQRRRLVNSDLTNNLRYEELSLCNRFRHFLDSGEQALDSHRFVNDIKPRCGGTYIAPDGIKNVIKWYTSVVYSVSPNLSPFLPNLGCTTIPRARTVGISTKQDPGSCAIFNSATTSWNLQETPET